MKLFISDADEELNGIILFLDSIREVNKLSSTEVVEEAKHNPVAENTMHMKLFRAQRNFYIAGFCLFLYL